MKHRWMGGLLVAAALTLAACAPPDQGAGDESPTPSPDAGTDAPATSPDAGEDASPTDSDGGMVDY
jgi:starvation-inducible outer membrane lipoprotein